MTLSEYSRYIEVVNPTLSNRSFGIQMSFVLGLISSIALIYSWSIYVIGILSSIFLSCLLATIFFETTLKYPKKIWMGLGFLLGRIFSPIILAVIFFILITPVGLLRRALGKDVLMLKNRKSDTFWKIREKKNFEPSEFFHQY